VEAGSIADDAFMLARTRIRCPNAKLHQFFADGVTMGKLGWFASMFDTDGDDQWDQWHPQDYILKHRKLRRFRLSTYDNKFVPDGYIENLKDSFNDDPNYIRAWIYGYFVPLWKGSAYVFNPEAHVIDEWKVDPHLDILLTFDFNAAPLAFVCNQRVKFDSPEGRTFKYIAYDEAEFNNTHLDDACAEFCAKHPLLDFQHTPIRIFGDRSGYSKSHRTRANDYEEILRYLKEYGYKRVYIEALTHNPLETVSVEALNRWFQNDEHLVANNCKNYKRSLLTTRWKDGVRKLDKPPKEDWTHFADAQKYLAYAIQHQEGQVIHGVTL